MDNKEVGRTKWSPPSNTAWEQQYRLELDRVRIENFNESPIKIMKKLIWSIVQSDMLHH